MDLQVVTLLDGALSVEEEANKATISALRNVSLKLTTLPSEFIHTLQEVVIEELKT